MPGEIHNQFACWCGADHSIVIQRLSVTIADDRRPAPEQDRMMDEQGFPPPLAPAPQAEPLRAALDDPGGEHCNECGQPVWVWWHAPDDLWASVTGREDGGGLRCIRCFDRAATEQGHLIEWRPIFHDHRGRPTYFFDLVRPHLTRRADSRAIELLRELADEVGRETISGNKRVHMGAWLRARNFLDSLKESGAVPASPLTDEQLAEGDRRLHEAGPFADPSPASSEGRESE